MQNLRSYPVSLNQRLHFHKIPGDSYMYESLKILHSRPLKRESSSPPYTLSLRSYVFIPLVSRAVWYNWNESLLLPPASPKPLTL